MSTTTPKVRKLMKEYILNDTQLAEVCRRFLNEIHRGLCKKTHDQADIKCFNTYVQDLPTGNEVGKYLALDLGGSNFRVLLISLKSGQDVQMKSNVYAIPQEIMTGPGFKLFDHIAECLATFMKEQKLLKECLPLGFTFSFPLNQTALTQGLLVRWTKGFNCPGVVGEDVVKLLKEAIERNGEVKISVMAILNDATGTLMSCAHKNPNCRVGVIIGTGCNACYIERTENVELYDGPTDKSHVIINCEMGAYGESGMLDFVGSKYDRIIDRASLNPGKQIYEKMISGMYMGEIVRLALLNAVRKKLIFTSSSALVTEKLQVADCFKTKFVSEIESDPDGHYTNCKKILNELGIPNASNEDCVEIRCICECVSRRAAYLLSCGLATLINKMDEPNVTVGVDGTVYRMHPKFKCYMNEKMRQLVKPSIKFDLMLSEDGSGRGAALVAATVMQGDTTASLF